MKKILIFGLLLITACSKETNDTKKEVVNNVTIEPTTQVVKETYVDDNPITVGLYQNGRLLKNYKSSLGVHKDIGYFEVAFTNDEYLGSSNVKRNFNKYYQNYQDISKYKIGYYIKFATKDKVHEKVILDPSSIFTFGPYIYIYLYDDVHQKDNVIYNHMEMKDVKDNTIYSSIKLYAADGAPEIISPITLMVFTYDGTEDFDEDGNYRGNSKYTLIIEKNV